MSNDTPMTRRRVVQTVGATASLGLAGSSVASRSNAVSDASPSAELTETDEPPSTTGTTEWPQFQGSAAKRGLAARGPSSNAVKWEYGDGDETVYHQPAVHDDVVYVPYANSDAKNGAGENGVVALTLAGEEVWTHETLSDIQLSSVPAVADGLVFVGGRTTDTKDCDGSEDGQALLLCLDAESGEVVYRRSVVSAYCKSPTVASGTVYAMVPGVSMDDGTLVAFERTTGEELWRYNTGASGISGYRTPPVAVADGRVYVAADGMFALDAATGEEVWCNKEIARLKGARQNAPAIANGTVYVGTGGNRGRFYALSADDGHVRWEFQTDSDQFDSAAVTDDTVYVTLTALDDPPQGVYALSAEDGTEKWFNGEVDSLESPVQGEEYVYVGATALTPDDGEIAWTVDENHANTAVAGDTLYLSGSSVLAVGDGNADKA